MTAENLATAPAPACQDVVERRVRTVGPSVQRGSTVLLPDAAALYDDRRVTYGRSGLETHAALADALAELEGAAAVRLFPSGLAAMSGAMLGLLRAGDDVLVTDAIYKPTRRFCENVLRRFGVSVRYYPPCATPGEIMSRRTAATRLVVMESPGSLTFEMQDVPGLARMAREAGLLTLIDNTWAAGHYFKPLAHGVDVSAQSLTKYVGGHSDVFMGSVAVADPAMAVSLARAAEDLGWAVSAEDCYLMLRGLRTLPTRMARHQESALCVAGWLADHPLVSEVLYPALAGRDGHQIWRRDYTGAAGLIGFVLGADAPPTDRFLNALKVFALGFSWGGFESLALKCDPQLAARTWPRPLGGPLIRLSVGLEDPVALIGDLEQALSI